MSKSVASESTEHNKSRKMSGKRGSDDEGTQDEAGILEVLLSGNNFLNTDDFCRLLVPFLPNDTLMTIRMASKPWSRVADAFIGDGVESGTMIVRSEVDLQGRITEFEERHKLVTRVIFLLNITKVGDLACAYAINLVVVNIPKGVKSIGDSAFFHCRSLTTVSFPTTLTSIDGHAFQHCCSLENVDLLHTNLQELGNFAFDGCSELKLMIIPDLLQTIGSYALDNCYKLVPESMSYNFYGEGDDDDGRYPSTEIVAYLRSKQQAVVDQA